MGRRDTDATWRTLGTLCRERDWSKLRLIHELQKGLIYRTIPEGHTVDWHHPETTRTLDVEGSTVTVLVEAGPGVVGLAGSVVGVEVLPPDAEVPASPVDALPSVQWAIATTRRLRAENKIPERTTKAAFARLLAAEAQRAARTGQIARALKASYIENKLIAWDIWPL